MLGDGIVQKHKIEFLREENDKFFRLLDEKSTECEDLKLKLKENQEKSTKCFLPLSLREVPSNETIFSQISGYRE